jgi:thiamine biosynthesis lipoprotein
MPVNNDLLSVTVIAEDGKLCDALSTSLFVMGSEKAVSYWKEHQDFDMIYVTNDGIFLTAGLSDKFTAEDDSDKNVYIIE